MWAVNRALREVDDFSGFLSLCRKQDVLIFVITHDRTYDCTNPHPSRRSSARASTGGTRARARAWTSNAALTARKRPVSRCRPTAPVLAELGRTAGCFDRHRDERASVLPEDAWRDLFAARATPAR
jgi:hypothetical protein